MNQICPRCGKEMVLQKASAAYSRDSLYYCQKCQTTIFLSSEEYEDQPLVKEDQSRKPRILLVDDDTDLLTLLDLQFKTAGFETVLATDGEEAYQKLVEKTPDLVIADIFLPTSDGWELSKKIRNSNELGYVPVILVTGIYTGPEFKSKALEIGVDAYVTKPYDDTALLNIANRLIREFRGITLDPKTASSIQAMDSQPIE